jgi:hypothetical protein
MYGSASHFLCPDYLEGRLQKQVLQMHAAKKRVGPTAWAKVVREPHYRAVVRATHRRRVLSTAMGAALALIS